MKVDNAIIMAAGTSSRFAPLSYEKHKAMTLVKGEVLIERQTEQLLDAGIKDIYIITGYKAEQFDYLAQKYGVKLIHNADYLTRNNHSSIWAVREVLGNSYICSSDNYFSENPFEAEVDGAYYATVYASEHTNEWCVTEDKNGYICEVHQGGINAWYLLGHAFWSKEFSKRFLAILEAEYDLPETAGKLWERIYYKHLDTLKLKARKYASNVIYEFDTMDELREFDPSYIDDTRSEYIRRAAESLNVRQADIKHIACLKGENNLAVGFEFTCRGVRYNCLYANGETVPVTA